MSDTTSQSQPHTTPTWPEWISTLFRLFLAGTGVLIWLWYGGCMLLVPQDFPWLKLAQSSGIIKHPQTVAVWFILVGILQVEAASRKNAVLRRFAITAAVFTCVSWIFTRELIAIVEGAGYLDAPLLWVYVLFSYIAVIMATQPGSTPPTPAGIIRGLTRATRGSVERVVGVARRIMERRATR